jgi:CRP/FNR family transcriptional regulator
MYIGVLHAEGEALGCDHPCFGCPVRDHAICNALANTELAAFRRSGSRKMLTAGETLCWQGDAATHVFTLTRGVLRLSKLLSDGRRQVAGFAFPGDFLGVTMEDEHPFTAEAVGEAELCQLTHARFDAFVASHPELERRLFTAATRELSATRDQLMLLGRKTAAERLASFILQMARRTAQTAGAPMQARLPMSRMDIADYLGLRIETVSRELSALKSGRLIRMLGVHELHVLAPERLTELAAGCASHEMT